MKILDLKRKLGGNLVADIAYRLRIRGSFGMMRMHSDRVMNILAIMARRGLKQ